MSMFKYFKNYEGTDGASPVVAVLVVVIMFFQAVFSLVRALFGHQPKVEKDD